MNQNRINIQIGGHTYSVVTDSPAEDVQDAAKLVDERMKTIAQTTKTVDTLRTAILTAMTFADDFRQLKKSYDEGHRQQIKRERRLIQLMDEVLGTESV